MAGEISAYNPNTLQRLRDWYERVAPKNQGQRTLFDISTGPVGALANLTTATEKNDKLSQVLELLGSVPGGKAPAAAIGAVAVDPKRLDNLLRSVPEYYHKFIREVLAKEAPTTINAFDPNAIKEALSEAYRRPPEMGQEHLLALTTPQKFLNAASRIDMEAPATKKNVEYLRTAMRGNTDFDMLQGNPKESLFKHYYQKNPTDRFGDLPFLHVNEALVPDKYAKAAITGHEGRHRAIAIGKELGFTEPYLVQIKNPDLLPFEDISGSMKSQSGYMSDKYYDVFEDPFNDLKNDPFGGLLK